MARRKKSSPLEDLMALVALLPWWGGVTLALVAYLGLHQVARQPVPVPTDPAQMGALLQHSLWRGLASVGQYVVPIICLVGAAASALRRRQRRALVENLSANPTADTLDGMDWQTFELLVGEIFRRQGFQVVETGGGGPDGGVDLVLRREGETHLVQCKQWRAYRVGVNVVRELYGVMAARGAASGYVVTSGRFTEEARAFAEGRHIRLLDGPRLLGLIRQVRPAAAPSVSTPVSPRPARSVAQAAAPAATPPSAAPTAPAASTAPPACPACGQAMVRRLARRGANAGQAFWGCTGYPGCRGTLPLR